MVFLYFYLSITNFFKKIKIFILKKYGLKIGSSCFISNDTFFDPSFLHLIEIGNNVTITANVKILAHDSSTKMHMGLTRIGRVKIENNVFIGMGSIILPNITIGPNSIIGAGSVVTNDVPCGVVVGGNPARVICSLEDFLKKHWDNISRSPQFDNRYLISSGITPELANEMLVSLKDSQGYII